MSGHAVEVPDYMQEAFVRGNSPRINPFRICRYATHMQGKHRDINSTLRSPQRTLEDELVREFLFQHCDATNTTVTSIPST